MTLTNDNALVNRDSGRAGIGSVRLFPSTQDYQDGRLDVDECVDVPYEIGLQQPTSFEFWVDFWMVPTPVPVQ